MTSTSKSVIVLNSVHTNIKKQVIRSEASKEVGFANIHVDNHYKLNEDTCIDYTFTLQGLPIETLEVLKNHIQNAINYLKK